MVYIIQRINEHDTKEYVIDSRWSESIGWHLTWENTPGHIKAFYTEKAWREIELQYSVFDQFKLTRIMIEE